VFAQFRARCDPADIWSRFVRPFLSSGRLPEEALSAEAREAPLTAFWLVAPSPPL